MLDSTFLGQEGQFIAINFDDDLGNLKLELFDAFNTSANTTDVQYQKYLVELADGDGDTEQISLAGLAQGDYYVRVSGEENPNYSLTFSAPPPLDETGTGDFAEQNNSSTTAYDLHTVEGSRVLTGLSIHNSTDTDWFQFTTTATAREGHVVRIDLSNNQGDLDLVLYNSNGQEIKRSETTDNFEEISLKDLAAGTYKVQVLGYSGATNPNYTLSFITPDTTINPDYLEPNNNSANAILLGQNGDVSDLSGLSIHAGDTDWFKFTTKAPGTISNTISIEFENAQGDLQLELYDKDNLTTTLKVSTGTTNNETLSLNGLPTDTYYAKVLGNGTATNNYQLHLDAPIDGGSPTTTPKKDDWTVFVYMTASDLAPYAFQDINEMEFAVSQLPSTVNFAVLWDQSSALASYRQTYATGGNSPWGDTGRAIIQADTDKDVVATNFEKVGEKNTGDPNTLVDFLNWGVAAAPANNYALVLWDHGGGDLGGFNVDNEGDRFNSSADRMYTNELVTALNTLKTSSSALNLKLIAFDACLMAMAEVCYALKDYTKTFVASEETEGGDGYDYTTAFSSLQFNPDQITPEALGSGIVASYQQQYQGESQQQDTHAAADTSKLNNFVTKLNTFTTAAINITSSSTWNAIYDARDAASGFYLPDYRDLGQFLLAVKDSTNSALSADLKTKAGEAYTALQELVIAKASDQRNTEGLSIYFPDSTSTLDSNYLTRNQTFLNATKWGDFLNAFKTRVTSRSTTFSGDWAESNDLSARAHNFNTLIGHGHTFTGLSLHEVTDQDWFRFAIDQDAISGDKVTLTLNSGQNVSVLLYSLSDRTNPLQSASIASGQASVQLKDQQGNYLKKGEYLIQVKGNGSVLIPDYSLTIDAPGSASNGNDWASGNNRTTKAHDLGVISAVSWKSGLRVDPSTPDWFEFETPKNQVVEPGTIFIKITGSSTLTAELRRNDGTSEGKFLNSQTGTGTLQVTYPGEPGQKYWLKISQSSGSATSYSLNFALYTNNIVGGSQSDLLVGGTKNDTLTGADGNDSLTGGSGNDSLIGGNGTDQAIESADASFTLTNSTLSGLGNDTLSGIEQANLTGGNSNNNLNASASLPSWIETCGLVTMEAALANCNVVASLAGYEREYYRHLAYYCDPADIESIRQAVVRAWENYEADQGRREQLKALILREYTWERAAQITLHAYEQVLGHC